MITEAFSEAFRLISSGDSDLYEILELSIQVGSSSLLISMLLGLPLGTVLAISRFPGKQLAVTTLNSLMGMPPVVVGLLVYLLLSRSGPLGVLGLLYTPTAMVIAQVVLITPIIAALTYQVIDRPIGQPRRVAYPLMNSVLLQPVAYLENGIWQVQCQGANPRALKSVGKKNPPESIAREFHINQNLQRRLI